MSVVRPEPNLNICPFYCNRPIYHDAQEASKVIKKQLKAHPKCWIRNSARPNAVHTAQPPARYTTQIRLSNDCLCALPYFLLTQRTEGNTLLSLAQRYVLLQLCVTFLWNAKQFALMASSPVNETFQRYDADL
jgi:hypothetical protein